MAIVENDDNRIKITDKDGDSLFTHGLEPDGSIVITCHDADSEEYVAVHLLPDEVAALLEYVTAEPCRHPRTTERASQNRRWAIKSCLDCGHSWHVAR